MIRFPWRKNIREPQAAKPHIGHSPGEAQRSRSPDESIVDSGASPAAGIRGERAGSIVSGARSLQSDRKSVV